MSFFLNNKSNTPLKGDKGEQGIPGTPGKDGADGKGVEDIGTAPLETTAQTVKEAINELKQLIDTNHPPA